MSKIYSISLNPCYMFHFSARPPDGDDARIGIKLQRKGFDEEDLDVSAEWAERLGLQLQRAILDAKLQAMRK